MFTQPASAPPSLATSTTPTSPASPHRPSRLRGLSYLRNFNHTHLYSRDNHSDNPTSTRRSSLGRAISYPSPDRQGDFLTPQVRSPTDRRSSADQGITGIRKSIEPAGGWLPTLGGQSALSRIATQPFSDSPPALLSTRDIGDTNTLSATMGRTRTANTNRLSITGVLQPSEGQDTQPQYVPAAALPKDSINSVDNGNQLPSIRFSQHQDVRAPRPSLAFSSMSRTLPSGRETIRVGRYSERDNQPGPASNVPSAAPIGFKSKVVSRRHCEFWFQDAQWFIKDVKSSSGTFLNHVRLSSPGTESKPFPIKDGDIVQLGIDFKGGEEMIFRCVKIRIELNRGWQSALNSFNVASHKRLRNMAKQNLSPTGGSSSQDCTICLGPVAPCQSLFVAPCSHTWHFKCVRRIINSPTWPQFICPNCRAVADLDADVDEPFPEAEWEEVDAADTDEQPVEDTHQNTNTETSSQYQSMAGRLDSSSASRPNGVSPRFVSQENAGEEAVDMESELQQALHFMAIASRENSTDLPQEPHIVEPLNIRSTKTISKRDGSNTRVNGSDADHLNRNDRTPSPTGNILSDGPLTPRNNAGPFVFDGSAGRLSQDGMPALSLAATTEVSQHGS